MLNFILVSFVSFLILVSFQSAGLGPGDSGDLVAAAFTWGIPHPPGYPLYTILAGLLTRIPLSTVAFRAGFMSSVPAALGAGLLYLIIKKLTGDRMISLTAPFLLLANYLYFLYGTTQEVFALNTFFLLLQIFFLMVWQQSKENRFLYWFIFSFGLSLSHHHTIIFALPSYIFWIYRNKKILKSRRFSLVRAALIFCLGLAPYIYIPVAASGHPIIIWEPANTLSGFINLVTRAGYGTFLSGSLIGAGLTERLLQIKAFFQYLVFDFTWIGIFFLCLGFAGLYRKGKIFLVFFGSLFVFLGPAYFFYASYPLLNQFSLGTYERFLLLPYTIAAIIICTGFYTLVKQPFIRLGNTKLRKIYGYAAYFSVSFFVFIGIFTNIFRFMGQKDDFQVNFVGEDLLNTAGKNSIFLVAEDIPLFSAQYLRYVQGYRQDVYVLFPDLIQKQFYLQTVSANFPELRVPEKGSADLYNDFLLENHATHEIFTNVPTADIPDGFIWVPHGLIYQMTDKSSLPTYKQLYDTYMEYWKKYHVRQLVENTGQVRQQLFLTEIGNIYNKSVIYFAKSLMSRGYYSNASDLLNRGIKIGGEKLSELYLYQGICQMQQGDCKKALDMFDKSENSSLFGNDAVIYYRGVTYEQCVGDPKKAEKYFSEFNKLKEKEDIILK